MATVTQVSKRYDTAAKRVEPERQYTVEEAVALLKEMPGAKFDESVDLSFRLGVDPKHADQMVRGAVVLPHGIGKTVRVAVFAKGEKEREAREAGADVIGAEDLVDNANAIIEAIMRAKPAAAKGTYLRSLTASTTMGPGVPVDAQRLSNQYKK